MPLPTMDEVNKKEQQIKQALEYKFNDRDIEEVNDRKSYIPFFFSILCGLFCI